MKAIACILGLAALLFVTPAGAQGPELNRADIDRRYRAAIPVDYAQAPTRDVIADLARRSGLTIVPDAPLVEYLRTHDRPVTCKGSRFTVAWMLMNYLVLQLHVEVVIDERAGGLLVRTPPATPTRWALEETVGPVEWRGLSLDDALRDVERRTGLRVDVSAAERPLLARARFDHDGTRRDTRGCDLLAAIARGQPLKVEPRADRVVALVSARLPREEIEARLDGRSTVTSFPAGTKLEVVAELVGSIAQVFVRCDPDVADAIVQPLPKASRSVRRLLDVLTYQAGATWRIDDGIIVLAPAASPPPARRR